MSGKYATARELHRKIKEFKMFLLEEKPIFEIDGILMPEEQWKKHIKQEFETECFRNSFINRYKTFKMNIFEEDPQTSKLALTYIDQYLNFRNQANNRNNKND